MYIYVVETLSCSGLNDSFFLILCYYNECSEPLKKVKPKFYFQIYVSSLNNIVSEIIIQKRKRKLQIKNVPSINVL